MTRKRTVLQVEQFITGRLKRLVRQDLRQHRIIREGDVECCAYFHLRHYLSKDWRIFARKHVKETGHFVDLVLFKGEKLRIPLELKWQRKRIAGKDRTSLNRMLERRPVRKAYFVSVLFDKNDYKKLGSEKTAKEKYKLVEIRVGLDKAVAWVSEWKKCRAVFKREMGLKDKD